jgi:phosphoglucomutase
LIYYTEDGSKIAARPSGTEPKIKFYVSVNAKVHSVNEIEETEKHLDIKIKNILQDLKVS